jgi:hypothetical protein
LPKPYQPQQKQPSLLTGAIEIDEDLEKIDLGQIAWPIRQRRGGVLTS